MSCVAVWVVVQLLLRGSVCVYGETTPKERSGSRNYGDRSAFRYSDIHLRKSMAQAPHGDIRGGFQ